VDYSFVKGHGTENDFVLIPDANGRLDLTPEQVARLSDRRAGIGADGVIRVVRTDATDDPAAVAARGEARWFMDYRNSDGSLSEMCGNGIRLFARHLVDEGLADGSAPIPVGTRDGVKVLTVDGELITADMGSPKVLGETVVSVGHLELGARHIDIGNPHAVTFVSSLDDAGPLLVAPEHDPDVYPDGVNVEFVVRRGDRHVAMRVHERGSGETRSCGTGACAVMVAAAVADGVIRDEDVTYRVDVPGGTLSVTWTVDDRVLLTGPAVTVASGVTDL
jgi:diaminopimelate epimerase